MFKPLDDRCVIRPDEPETKTPGGIVLPDQAQEKPVRGKVLAVGPGRLLDNGTRAAMQLRVGDRVLFTRFLGAEIDVDDGQVRIIREGDILAVIEGK